MGGGGGGVQSIDRTNDSGTCRPISLNIYWPPNSPYLNPVDYSSLENVSQRVHKHHLIRDVQHMKEKLEEKGEELPQYKINTCINQFSHRLRKVIEVAGRHIVNNVSRIAVLG